MVTSSGGCLTPEGHFAIDCLSPSWLRSCQMLALSECRGWGVERRASLQAATLPIGNLSQTASSRLHTQPLSHRASPTAVITTVCSLLIIVFLQEPQTPSQVLPVHTSASAPAQLLRHAITCIQWGNLTQTHSHRHFFFISPGSLEIQLYCELNSTLEGMCLINVWTIYHTF